MKRSVFAVIPLESRVKRVASAVSVVVLAFAVSSCAVGVRKPATYVTDISATLNGNVLSVDGGPGRYYIEYGTTLARTDRTPTRPITFVEDEIYPVSEPVQDLTPGTTYHYAVCAEDESNAGDPKCSRDQTFTTGPAGVGRSGIAVTSENLIPSSGRHPARGHSRL